MQAFLFASILALARYSSHMIITDPNEYLETLLDDENWKKAEHLLRKRLRRDPDDHWDISRLCYVLWKQSKYDSAITCGKKAIALAPTCPLANWEYASALQEAGRHNAALSLFKKLHRRGAQKVASDPCGEGVRNARSIVTDCECAIAASYEALGQRNLARKWYRIHLQHRRRGTPSVYAKRDVERSLQELSRTSSRRRISK